MARPREHTPEKILAATRDAFRAEGVSVSTAQIAKAAGISVGTLFNHFGTKQVLIDALYLEIKGNLAAAIGVLDTTDPVEHRIRQVWDRWFNWARNNQDAHIVMTLLYHAGLPSPQAQTTGLQALQGPIAVLEEALEVGLLVDLPMEYLGALIEQQLDQAVMADLDDAQAATAFSVLWNGVTTTRSNAAKSKPAKSKPAKSKPAKSKTSRSNPAKSKTAKRTSKQSATKRNRKAVSP